MALKNLSTEAMVDISTAWLDAARDRRHLEEIPLLRSLLPALDTAHQALLAARRSGGAGAADAELARMRDKASAIDERHDRKARGSYWLLTGLAELAEDPARSASLLDLRDRLLPKGLATAGMSHAAEAGNVINIKPLLDPKRRAALREIHTDGGRTLEDEVDAWIAAGEELGRIDLERSDWERSRGEDDGAAGDARAARSAWIRAAQALSSNLELSDADDPTYELILSPLRLAEARADRRTSPGR